MYWNTFMSWKRWKIALFKWFNICSSLYTVGLPVGEQRCSQLSWFFWDSLWKSSGTSHKASVRFSRVVLGTHVHVCCPVSPSPPYMWDDHWSAGDLMARVKGEGHLEQSLLKMLPSGDTGGCAFSSRAGPGCPGLCSSENSMFKTTLCSSFLWMAADGKAFVGGKRMSWLWPFTRGLVNVGGVVDWIDHVEKGSKKLCCLDT